MVANSTSFLFQYDELLLKSKKIYIVFRGKTLKFYTKSIKTTTYDM